MGLRIYFEYKPYLLDNLSLEHTLVGILRKDHLGTLVCKCKLQHCKRRSGRKGMGCKDRHEPAQLFVKIKGVT